MGNAGAVWLGMKEAPVKYEDRVSRTVQLLETATREKHGGKYWNLDNDGEIPW